MGRVTALSTARSALTHLQHRMIGLGRALATAAVALCAIVLALGLARGQSAELMVITAISLMVAAVPESLPVVVTLAHALGARRMTARNALAAVIWALYAFFTGRLGGKAFEDQPWAGLLVAFGGTVVISTLIEATRRITSRRKGGGTSCA